ncbi:MAG: hypothetical protein ACR2MO_08565 [Acidimicrobiales bacterium]
MPPSTVWDTLTPFHTLGLGQGQAAPSGAGEIPGVARSSGPALGDDGKPWHPDSPLFWFGLIAAATIGLVAASTQVRLGPLKASLSAGKT